MFKYVMFVNDDDCHMPVIFPKNFVHKDVADAILKTPSGKGYKVLSAGDCHVTLDEKTLIGFRFVTDGYSETLEVNSRKTDGDIITCHPWHFGYDIDNSIILRPSKGRERRR